MMDTAGSFYLKCFKVQTSNLKIATKIFNLKYKVKCINYKLQFSQEIGVHKL